MILVSSYNIRKAIASDWRRRPERTLTVLEEVGADVVALQEADRRFGPRLACLPLGLMTSRTRYRHVPYEVRAGSIGWHGNAILVSSRVEIMRHAILHLPVLEPRGAVLADLRIEGVDLRVVGMHLDISGLWRRAQMRSILAQLATQPTALPTILMGDSNEWRSTGGFLHDLGPHFAMADCGPSFPARYPVGRLDRIVVGPGFDIVEAGVHRSAAARTASDHLPVWAKIRPAA
jgi:endonuclease/exonuclease/phosphatase family metal-dependent hydrolase